MDALHGRWLNGWRRSLTATRMLRAILYKSWQQLYIHRPPITKTIKVRQTRHAGHCWRSRDKLISDVLLWTPSHGRAKAGRPARTCIQQLCEDTGCSPEDLPEAMNDKEEWRKRVRDIRAGGTTRWWWLIGWWLITETSANAVICKTFCKNYILCAWNIKSMFLFFIIIISASSTCNLFFFFFFLFLVSCLK